MVSPGYFNVLIYFVADDTVSRRGQCGGISWTGATCCATGNACVFVNSYYYQCQSATAAVSSVRSFVLCDQVIPY